MTKKILSFVLALICFASMAVVGASAAEDTTIYFEVPADWNNYSSVYCHIWAAGGDSLAAWQSKKEKCTKVEDGLYSYDISKVGGLEDGVFYGVIFSVDIGLQTYDALMSSQCYGDTLYCDGTIYENPQDSSKTAIAAFWKNQDKTEFGPVKQISSIGNVVGTCLAPGETDETLFAFFLVEWLDDARTYSNKDDQAIIDDICADLNISAEKADEIIKTVGVEVAWKNPGADNSSTRDEVNIPSVNDKPSTDDEPATNDELGDVNMDGKLNIRDATYIQKYLAKMVNLEDAALALADYDENGKVNIKDATAIQKKLAKIN